MRPDRVQYVQTTGEFFLVWPDGTFQFIGKGYSGHGDGKNNPDLQHVQNVGPIPVGDYAMSSPVTHPTCGPLSIRLFRYNSTNTYGRAGFLIHGNGSIDFDHNGLLDDASHGCPIADHDTRDCIARWIAEGLTLFRVVRD